MVDRRLTTKNSSNARTDLNRADCSTLLTGMQFHPLFYVDSGMTSLELILQVRPKNDNILGGLRSACNPDLTRLPVVQANSIELSGSAKLISTPISFEVQEFSFALLP